MIIYDQSNEEVDVRFKIHNRFFGRKFSCQYSQDKSNKDDFYNHKKFAWPDLVPTEEVPNKLAEPFLVSNQMKGWKLTSEAKRQYVLDLILKSHDELSKISEEASKLDLDQLNALEIRRQLSLMQSIRYQNTTTYFIYTL
jgi:hypothetical protein